MTSARLYVLWSFAGRTWTLTLVANRLVPPLIGLAVWRAALPGRRNVWRNLWGTESDSQKEQILSILDRVQLMSALTTPAKYLSHGQRQWLGAGGLALLLGQGSPDARRSDHRWA